MPTTAERISRLAFLELATLGRTAITDITPCGLDMTHGLPLLRKRPAFLCTSNDVAGKDLPSLDDEVDISWVNLVAQAAASDPFSCNQRSAATQERVEYQITALRAVENGEATITTGLTVG
jgi:hypothetical protein